MEKMQIRLENWYIMLITLFVINIGYTQTQRIYTTSGTFTPPAGVSTIQVEAYGAGGGGGYGGTSNKDGGGGGGGGGFSKNTSISVSAGTTYTITIGTLGLGSTSSVSPNGGNGGNTTATFGSTTITANGGIGGFGYSNGGAGGTGGTGSTFNGGAGGAGLNGQGSGGGGGAAGTSGNGGIGSVPTGGSAGGGNAGAGGNGTTSPTGVGLSSLTNYGGGGGGGTKNSSGGNGANGYMIITYTCPTYSLTNATTSNSPICVGSSALVNLNSSNLGTGTYTVTFNLSGATNSTGNTSTMNFVAGNPGSGTFSTPILNIGVTNITITNLSSSNCSNSINSFNTTSVTANLPSTANAGNNIVACSSDLLIPITSGSSASNYISVTWTSNGTGTFTNPNSLTNCFYTPSSDDIIAGNITITLTSTSTGCADATSNKNLTLVNAPVANAGIEMSTCSSNGSINVTDNSSASNYTSLEWTSSGTGTFTNSNSLSDCFYTPSADDITAGSVTLTLTAYGNAPCLSSSASKNLIISQPIVADAGANFYTCYTSGDFDIATDATASNFTSVTWTSDGTGTLTNENSLTTCTYLPSVTDISTGYVTFTLTASNLGCSDITSTKTVIMISSPTADAGSEINTCSSTGAVNITAGSNATNYSYVEWSSNGTGSFTDSNSLTDCTYTPSADDITAGSVILTLTAYGNSPCASTTVIKNLIISQPVVVDAGIDYTTCYSSGDLNIATDATASNYTSVIWTSNGTGIFTNENSLTNCKYTPSPTDISTGNVTFTITASNSGCSDVNATKTITIIQSPTVDAGTEINTCASNGAVNITAGSNATNYSSVEWSSDGTGTFSDSNSLTDCTYTPSADDITAGSVVLTLTTYGNAPCASITATKNLTISQPIVADAGADFTICYSSGDFNISSDATASNYISVTWTSNGTGTFINTNSLNNCSYTPSATDILTGNVTFTLTASNSGCSDINVNKTITIISAPTANAGAQINTCSSSGAVNITAGSSASNYTSVLWTSNGTGTFTNATSLTNCTYTPSSADNSVGTVILTLTAFGNAPCSDVTATKNLIITQPLVVYAGANFTTCYTSGNINIATDASALNYTSVTWTSNGTGTFINANSLNNCSYNPSATDLSTGNVIFYLTVSNPGCSQATSTKTVIIKSPPTSLAGTQINTCSTNGAVNITAGSSAANYTSILWTSSGTGSFSNANSLTACTYTPSAADITAGIVTLTLTANNSPCTSVSSTKNLIINLGPTAIAGSNFSNCYSTGSINITTGSSATNQTNVIWTSNGSGTFTNPNSLTACTYTPSATDVLVGSVSFTLTASNAGCADATSTKTLTISSQPTSIAGSTINTCSTSGAVNITTGASASNYNSVIWTSNGSGTFSNANSLTTCTYTPSAADISAGTVTLTLTANGNAPCAPATSTKNLIINQTMTALAGASFTECSSNTSINVTSGASATNQSIVTWSSNGTGTFANQNSLTTCTYTPSAADIASGSVIITLTASNSSCPNITSSKTITLVSAPMVDAGSDIATCSTCGTVNITANSSASNYTSIVWTSSGTGTFTNANSLTACTYTPSAADITTSLTQGGITLTLTATGTSPCTTTIATKVLAITSQTFTSSGTFTVPAGVYQVTVEAWGGGGKGGDGLNIGNVGGGGGGGAYSAKSIPVIPGNTYTVNVGLGATTVSDGGDSWFINQSTFLAKGGKTALNNVTTGAIGGSESSSIGDITSRGGNGANGLSGSYGGGGGAGAEAGENMGVDAVTSLGAIAVCSGGNGGNGYTNPNGDGSPGIAPGGGGGGGRRNGNNGVNQGTGGRGADGKVIIKWPVNALPSTLTNGPGGVTSDLQLWLRSDLLNGTTTVADNTPVTTWYTQAKGANAIKPTAVGAPVYRNNANYNINFNAVVDFTNPYNSPSQVYTDLSSSRQYLKGTNGYYSEDTFVVVIPDVTVTSALNSMDVFGGKSSPCAQNAKSGISYGNVDTRFTNEVLSYTSGTTTSYGTAQVSTTTQYNSPGIINIRNNSGNTGMQLYYNSNNIATTEVNASKHRNIYDSQYWIGRSEAWDGSLDGRVAEVITFSSRKNDATERTKIESYLGIKYGITLGVNGTSQNYLASDGTIIWNASTNAGFNNDIAGIGRDDASKLNQKQSKSVNANSIVTIGLGTVATTNTANTNVFDTDKKYLVWGDNGANMNNSGTPVIFTFGGTSGVTTSTEVLNRKWKIVETGGDVATTKVSVLTSALANLPALSGNDAYVMVVASDASFTTGLEMTFLKTNSTKQETDYDFDGTKYFTFGIAHESKYTRHATFDGTSNIMKMEAVNNLSSPFTMMTWVRPTGANSLSNDRTIVSKFNGTTGYRVFLSSNNKVNVSWSGGTTLTSNTVLPNNEWHNVAIIYSSGSIKLYIDGVLDSTVASTAPASNTNYMSIGAEYRTKSDTRNYFKGDIDEFRLWNKALSITEVRFIMNQEILQDGSVTKGTIIPNSITKNDVSTLNWSNLQAYYSMNSFIGTHINDDSLSKNRGNVFLPTKTTITIQSSPQPYESAANGLWYDTTSWLNGSIQQMPYSLSIVNNTTPIDWNIVKTNHNLDSSGNKVVLGLLVNSNTISATNDSKIEVSHYLKLDGKIDLVGKSQLVQTTDSDLDVTSAGSVERDQQGQSNKFNYNYWSSPVSSINNSTINHGYTVAGVMKDGTNPNNIQNLLWTTGINSSATSPITLSSYWIFKFQNISNNYANWSAVGQNGSLLAGQGYTLKGSSAATSNQNYTFVGKPNNGTINSPVAANNLNLSGNPYASAIDANKFIDDNASSIVGTLYFWEHYSTNSSHNTVEYQGGYATYTKTGGTAPVAPAGVSGLGSSSKVAKRFIPVGQGFFVTGSAAGGTITFNNSQRLFVKEDNANSFNLFRTNNTNFANADVANNNSEDNFTEEQFMKIRLGYNSADNYHRQILLGFMNDNATSGYDNGYDALSIETLSNDMYFLNGTNKLNISGEGYFNVDNIYPLGVKNAVAGNVTFMVDQKINIDNNQEVYIFDNVTNTYNSIKDQNFQINLPAGTYENRFSLRFTDGSSSLGTNDNEQTSEIVVSNSIVNNTINVKNNSLESTVKSVLVFNMIGQQVKTWNVENQDQNNIEFSTKGMSTGTYIVKVITDNGNISKKILIK
ncbi:LamG-like jellyroll fold domain-containing protein [Flavobacterium capsici]|uniref:LamG-like jellyroll fold domain-containing protein n=1 Tax=Flavobacterium capsici TaxID=3075618 RepID=A0AA96J921_9FLAO|nr:MULTISPECIES: LamG-like jellyroll fold domain-containing protein [unclassified Flavobacterium]WNM19021.1 LamG-like jellyroll fold domain-containing protein [Flavobacterium sp. PMR2A8]WNM23071.1 LamG-like jellyroll fold domain-containing protein [Flavobacterium sp. PMTSA4]